MSEKNVEDLLKEEGYPDEDIEMSQESLVAAAAISTVPVIITTYINNDFPDIPDYMKNQVIPFNYTIDKINGTTKAIIKQIKDQTSNTKITKAIPQTISPAIFLIDSLVVDPEKALKTGAIILEYSHYHNKWLKRIAPVDINDLTEASTVKCIVDDGMVLGDREKKEFARFFTDYINVNAKINGFDRQTYVHQIGWYDGVFLPFGDKRVVPAVGRGSKKASIMEAILTPREGYKQRNKDLIEEYKHNPVFLVIMAGMVASPLIAWVKGQEDNIGIDLYGESSGGKTLMQLIAGNLIWGCADELVFSWKGSTMAALWDVASFINGVPMILDDSHQMDHSQIGIPHSFLNGKERIKSEESGGKNKWEAKDPKRTRGVFFFNGEVSIADKTTGDIDSAGIYGRVFMINKPPFMGETNGDNIENLHKEAKEYGGQFLKEWLDFITAYGVDQFNNDLDDLKHNFQFEGDHKIRGRLATKASTLLWAVKKFGELSQIDFDLNLLIETINSSTKSSTDNVGVTDKMIKSILVDVWEIIGDMEPNSQGVIMTGRSGMVGLGSDIDILYREKEYVILSKGYFEKLLSNNFDKKDSAVARQQLHSTGFISDREFTRYSRPNMEGETTPRKITGIKILYHKFSPLLPKTSE